MRAYTRIDNQSSETEESDFDTATQDKLILMDNSVLNEINSKKEKIEMLISKQNDRNNLNLNKFSHTNINTLSRSRATSQSVPNEKLINDHRQSNGHASSFFKSTELIKLKNTKINQGILQGLNMFHRRYQNGFVDVWWLYDDGGNFLGQ
jgi:hypothetical protein